MMAATSGRNSFFRRWRTVAIAASFALGACASLPPSQARPGAAPNQMGAAQAAPSRMAQYVPMRDGVELALTVYLPAREPGTRHPVLLWVNPDRRERIDPVTGQLTPIMAPHDIAFFNAQGYAIALAEMRGGGASFGARELDRGPQIGRDGADLVRWITRQDWSDGNLGMIGASYQGFTQYATAAEAPEGLRAIFPEIAGFDDYTSMFNPGGILNLALSQYAAGSMAMAAENRFDPARGQLPSAPVIDEDGDGELADEIPLDTTGDGTFLDEAVPSYADGAARRHVYLRATREHAANNQLTVEALAAAPYRDSSLGGTAYTYADVDPGLRPQAIAQAGIAVYNRGGWFDYHARDTALWFATLAGRTPTRLMMAPTGHGGFPREGGETIYRAGPYFSLFDDPTTEAMLNQEKLRFFDHHVRGIDNGFAEEDPVLIYVMGKGWRREREWPLARAQAVRFSAAAGGRLDSGAAITGQDQYQVDFAASSLSAGANRWNYGISRATTPMTLDGGGSGEAARRLAYQSDPLAVDTEVTGHPLVELLLSADAAEADVFVYLEDVAPDGTSLLVSEGQLRANYHRLVPIDTMLAPQARSMGVRPQLPWQGFTHTDYAEAPLADGARLRLTFDLMPTAWVFRAGHRIRLSFAGADSPSFAPHPALASGQPVTWTVWRGPGATALILPIIPAHGEPEQ